MINGKASPFLQSRHAVAKYLGLIAAVDTSAGVDSEDAVSGSSAGVEGVEVDVDIQVPRPIYDSQPHRQRV